MAFIQWVLYYSGLGLFFTKSFISSDSPCMKIIFKKIIGTKKNTEISDQNAITNNPYFQSDCRQVQADGNLHRPDLGFVVIIGRSHGVPQDGDVLHSLLVFSHGGNEGARFEEVVPGVFDVGDDLENLVKVVAEVPVQVQIFGVEWVDIGGAVTLTNSEVSRAFKKDMLSDQNDPFFVPC